MNFKKYKEFAFEICFIIIFTIIAFSLFQDNEKHEKKKSRSDSDKLFVGNAGCLIKKDGKILLVEQNSGKLGTPGGGTEEGETAIETAVREVFEETQMKVKPVRLLNYFSNSFFLFECKIIDEPKNIGPTSEFKDEIKSAGFYDVNTLSAEDLRFTYQYKTYKWFQNYNKK